MAIHVYDGGTWQEILPGDNVNVYDGGWQQALSVHVYDGGWQQVYQNSDPMTYRYYASSSSSWRAGSSDTWRSEGDMHIGSYGGLDNATMINFLNVSTSATGGDGVNRTIQDAMALRPVCSSASVALDREVNTGNSITGTGNTWYSSHNYGNYLVGVPSISTMFQTSHTGSVNGPDSFYTSHAGRWFNIHTGLPYWLGQGRQLVFTNVAPNSFPNAYNTDNDYSSFDPVPYMDITVDYQ